MGQIRLDFVWLIVYNVIVTVKPRKRIPRLDSPDLAGGFFVYQIGSSSNGVWTSTLVNPVSSAKEL